MGFEQSQLFRRRQAAGGELGVLEIGRHAVVGPVELVLVEPLEVEGVSQRLAHTAVPELGQPRVDEEGLTPDGLLSGSTFLTSHPSSTAEMS